MSPITFTRRIISRGALTRRSAMRIMPSVSVASLALATESRDPPGPGQDQELELLRRALGLVVRVECSRGSRARGIGD